MFKPAVSFGSPALGLQAPEALSQRRKRGTLTQPPNKSELDIISERVDVTSR